MYIQLLVVKFVVLEQMWKWFDIHSFCLHVKLADSGYIWILFPKKNSLKNHLERAVFNLWNWVISVVV